MTLSMRSRTIAAAVRFVVLACAFATTAHAQPYPSKPIRFVVPTSPGGATDFVARLLAPRMAEALGQPVVVENRVGASGLMGAEGVSKSGADGYTLLAVFDNFVTNPYLFTRTLAYDPLRDFTAIALVAKAAQAVVVPPALGVKRYEDLLALARSKGSALNYATAGPGTSSRLSMELLKGVAGIDPTAIHYKGGSPAMTALLGGQVDVMIVTLGTVLPHLRSGKLLALAVTSTKRHPMLPDAPPLADYHAGFEAQSWVGVLGPPALPKEIVAKVEAAVRRASADADVRERLAAQAYEVVGAGSDAFAEWLRVENERWSRVIREHRITVE